MALALKKFIVALAALLFGVGHAACACLPNAPMAAVAQAGEHSHHSGGEAAQHHAGHQAGGADHGAPCGPQDDSCAHCQLAQYAAAPDAAKLQAPTLAAAPLIAILASVTSPEAPTLFLKAAARLHWAAPPGATPVSLKIRLLI